MVLATSMGAQNSTARRLAVPDLTTTVLTLTITGIAADSALVGALFVVHAQIVYPLMIALATMAIIAVTTQVLTRPDPDWARTRS